jgi:dethiobiotin synthetase
MTGGLVVVTGTGTEIGKTHTSEALLRALGVRGRVAGIKPVESGVAGSHATDADRLRQASTFHVQHFAYRFDPAVSPHLAARAAGLPIDLGAICTAVARARDLVDLLLVELPGGLFTPLTDTRTNADLAAALAPDTILLVAPDRLGVLHDVGATLRAARTVPLGLPVLALVAPAVADASTGSNAAELRAAFSRLVSIPRAPAAELASHPSILALAGTVATLCRLAD